MWLKRRLAKHAGLRVFRFFSRPIDAALAAPPAAQKIRPLSESDVLALCEDPELDLRSTSVAAAYKRGDFCIGAFQGDSLTGYCWFAFSPLPHLDGVWVEFGSQVAWIYKSFVRSSHRGRAIASALYRHGDDLCRERGGAVSVICVESHNVPSISAALRAGYGDAGRAAYVRRGSMFVSWGSSSVRRHGINFFVPPISMEDSSRRGRLSTADRHGSR